jgi:hypothetical protein
MEGWLFPGNISRSLITPMFAEWRQREPRNVNAWLYPMAELEWGAETAFLLEPENPVCQYVELSRILPDIAYAVHELAHIGYVVVPREEFSAMITSLIAVTGAMGSNLSPTTLDFLSWVQAVGALNLATRADLRPDIEANGIVRPKNIHLYKVKPWFVHPPEVRER